MLRSAAFVSGHALQLLQGGGQYFPALISAVDAAQSEVRLETYIFHFDVQGIRVAEALERAALRGVSVYLVMDGVGTPVVPQDWQIRWGASGVRWHQYAPLGVLGVFIPGRWRRMHRKLCVVDVEWAFCGGINILDDCLDPHHGPLKVARLDYAVKVQGPLVVHCQQTMAQFWARLEAARQLEQLHWKEVRNQWPALGMLPKPAATPLPQASLAGSLAALVLRDNLRNRTRIERAYLKAIGEARKDIVLANAYFLPGVRLRRALQHAVRRGVRVRVVVQGRYEYFMQYHAARPVLRELALAGVEIYEYIPGFLHAKVAVADSVWATVGSSNLDPLSLLLAREANVMVHDAAFARQLDGALSALIHTATRRWDLKSEATRPWQQRLRDRLAFAFMRVLLFFHGSRY
nr:cardiolipin synthase ClsB [uncultured Rhodoferax sp.]